MKHSTKIACLYIMLLLFGSCGKDEIELEPADKPSLEISATRLDFSYISSVLSVNVITNTKDVTCGVMYGDSWCTASYSAGVLTVSVTANPDSETRSTSVTVQGDEIKKTVTVFQSGRKLNTAAVKDDIKISVKNGTDSSHQGDSDISKSFDGNMSTNYHSQWGDVDRFPITLTYNFENVTAMDYLVYYPRTSGSNGLFKEFELWIATQSEPDFKKYGDYDFAGSSSPGRIDFSPALANPVSIRFVVKSGVGDNLGIGFASCAEMEFYRKNPDNFDCLSIFTDMTCSQLKNGVGEAQIQAVDNQFFRDLAMEIYKGEYDSEFRVQSYRSWQHPDIMAKENRTTPYGLRDNPTGIYAAANEDLIVLVDETRGQNLSLFIQDPNGKIGGTSYLLAPGINKLKAAHTGLMYILYYTQTGTEEPVKINIATGNVNGYFDSQKHRREDWQRLLGNAKFRHFDLLGKYVSLTFETAAFRNYTPDGMALADKYDDLNYLEQDFMGLVKYNRMFKNRAYFLVIYDSYMYASGNYTAYNSTTQVDILDVAKLGADACWGPAHELGHIHQTTPGLKWHGMTEVTNNIHSLYVQTQWGNVSRLQTEGIYAKAKADIIDANKPHNGAPADHFYRLVPFWQLKLYVMDALGKRDFYRDIYEKTRTAPEVNTSDITEGYYQLQFVKFACESAQLDLTDFFGKWGFLTPIDQTMDDYGSGRFTITQSQINAVKAEIASKGYPKPAHNNIYDIRDDNVNSFK